MNIYICVCFLWLQLFCKKGANISYIFSVYEASFCTRVYLCEGETPVVVVGVRAAKVIPP